MCPNRPVLMGDIEPVKPCFIASATQDRVIAFLWELFSNVAADTGARANDKADRLGHLGYRLV